MGVLRTLFDGHDAVLDSTILPLTSRPRLPRAQATAFLGFPGGLFKKAADTVTTAVQGEGHKRCCCENKGYLVPRSVLPPELAKAPVSEVCKLGGWQRGLYPKADHRFPQNAADVPFHWYRRDGNQFEAADAENDALKAADKRRLPPAHCSCKGADAVNFEALKDQYQLDLHRQVEQTLHIKLPSSRSDKLRIKEFLYSDDPNDTEKKFVCCCANTSCEPSQFCDARGTKDHWQPDDWVKEGMRAKSNGKEGGLSCAVKGERAARFETCMRHEKSRSEEAKQCIDRLETDGNRASAVKCLQRKFNDKMRDGETEDPTKAVTSYGEAFARCTDEAPSYKDMAVQAKVLQEDLEHHTTDPWHQGQAGAPAAGTSAEPAPLAVKDSAPAV